MGLEPQWDITVVCDTDNEVIEDGHGAEIYFEPTYHHATLHFDPCYLMDREEWVGVLIHEMLHLLISPLREAATSNTGKAAEEALRKGDEMSTSLIQHVMVPLFGQVYAKELEQWM